MAKDINEQIEERIRAFAAELNDLVRRAALESVHNALGGGASTTASARAATTRAGRGAGAQGRRSPRQMAGTIDAVREFVANNPGARMEQMTAALGQPAARLRGPVNKLIEQGIVRKTGEKRATKYYPARRGGSAAKGSATGTTRRKTRKKKSSRKKTARKR
ncbi:MAG: hypothetical protein ACOCXM_00100 [Myxococcota bacterium]